MAPWGEIAAQGTPNISMESDKGSGHPKMAPGGQMQLGGTPKQLHRVRYRARAPQNEPKE